MTPRDPILTPTTSSPDLRRRRRRNELMKGGNAATAERRVNDALKYLHGAVPQGDPRSMLVEALRSLMPWVETTTVKVGGASYQVPMPMDLRRSEYLAVKWLVDASLARLKKDRLHGTAEALALETRSVLHDVRVRQVRRRSVEAATSSAMQQKLSMHRTAKVNRVFSHRRWR